ncbi:NAD-dependent epimerase/dehydratase family protein [Bacteroidota bacterium]
MILVTGGTGLVGSHLLLELTGKHEQIRAIHRPQSDIRRVQEVFSFYLDNPEERFNKIEWVPGDITDIDSLIEVLDGVEYVYHAAANVSFQPGSLSSLQHNNVGGTANVVNACLESNIAKLCYVSSTAALGTAPVGGEVTEDLIWANSKSRSMYSISKFQSEMEVWRGMAEGLKAVIVNPSIIIGPSDWKRSSSYLFTAVWKGMQFYTKGVTGYVDIRDVITSMVKLMEGEQSNERFTVSSENLSYQQVLAMIAEVLGKKPPRFLATPFLISLAWRGDWLICKLTGRARSITRDAAKSSNRKTLFSNQKISEATGIVFMPIKKSIQDTARYFLKVHSN